MVVDTSAILAILLQEDDAQSYVLAIEAEKEPLVSAATVIEAGIVLLGRRGPTARPLLDAFLKRGGFQVVPLTAEHAQIALDACERYGKGRHGARLNFGDCIAYALAKSTGKSLLYKGSDFSRTDIASA